MPQPRTSPITHACPFVAGPMITNPGLFVGRKDALRTITTRMTGPQPTSINIVGKKRIGKSSLLYHFFQTWEQRVDTSEHNRYVVIYLSLQDADCRKEPDFYKAVAQELRNRPAVRTNPTLATPLNTTTVLNRQAFSSAIEKWQAANVLPVLCLDTFEALLDKPQDFPNDFYDNLRSLMNKSALMLVIASTDPVKQYAQKKRLTSDFFNVGQTEILGLFTEEEVNELVRLPARDGNNLQAILGITEQQLARKWAENHPYLLQLASIYLWEASQQSKDVEWAKHRFDEQVRYVPRPRFTRQKLGLFLRSIMNIMAFPAKLVDHVGGLFNRIIQLAIGVIVIRYLILIALDTEKVAHLIEWLQNIVGW